MNVHNVNINNLLLKIQIDVNIKSGDITSLTIYTQPKFLFEELYKIEQ